MKVRHVSLALALTLAACTDAPMPTGQATAAVDSPGADATSTLDAVDAAAGPMLAARTSVDWDARDRDGEWCPIITVGATFEYVPSRYPIPVYQGMLHVWRGGAGQAADWSEVNDGFSQVDSLPHRIQFTARRAFSFGVPGPTLPNGWVDSDYSRGWRRSYSLDTEWRRFKGGAEPADHSYLDASGHKQVHARMRIDIPYYIRNVKGYLGPGKTQFWFFPREGFGDRFGDHPCDTVVKLNPKRLFRRGRS